ncbi:MAG: glycosyltransferase family 9 protein [Candidatus Fermentibacteraceae bacterium]|nr:glycosyltransferase family 9 protein [Candidatus Fermentibacteraceae bacterium]
MANTESSTICSSQFSRTDPVTVPGRTGPAGSCRSTAVIRLHSLGDVVLAQPAAARLSEGGSLFLVTSREYAPVAERMENVIPVMHDRETGLPGLRRLLRDMAPERIVDLQNSMKTRLATLGMNVTGRFRMDRGLRKRVLRGDPATMPARRLDFLGAAGFTWGCEPSLVRSSPPPEDLAVGLGAGGRWRLKSIPSSVIAEAARLLIDLYGARVTITGGPGEEDLVTETSASVMRDGVMTYCGEDGISGLIEVLEGLSLFVSPDSGPAHLAKALGVPVMVVFTSTSPALGFWEQEGAGMYTSGRLDCRPCHRHGGEECSRGDEACRRGILPLDLVRNAMEMAVR